MKRGIENTLRTRLHKSLKGKVTNTQVIELVGCTIQELWNHLESLFTEGMTRYNHGRKGWHIDHIKPCSMFDLNDIEQQKECFHYTNLQPLWAKDNLSKGKKTDEKIKKT